VNTHVSPDPQLQADTLIAEIQKKAVQSANDATDAAAREAQAILQSARDKARRQLQRARADLRQMRLRRLAQVKAELETTSRRRASARTHQLLARAWPLLETALERRWRATQGRERWIAALLDEAVARLAAGAWVVRHPADLDPAARSHLRAALDQRGGALATLVADAALRAGLIVEIAGVRLDATPRALLADRYAVEAALLALIAHEKTA
jgi:vacuolar-type H+-ATPase subunit E/Vma4